MKRRASIATVLRRDLFELGACLVVAGCGGISLSQGLNVTIGALQAATDTLDVIQGFVTDYFRAKPDATKEKEVDDAIAKTREGLITATKLLEGVEAATQLQIDNATKDFKAAWDELVKLVGPLGVKISKPGEHLMMSEGEHGIVVDEPEILSLRSRR